MSKIILCLAILLIQYCSAFSQAKTSGSSGFFAKNNLLLDVGLGPASTGSVYGVQLALLKKKQNLGVGISFLIHDFIPANKPDDYRRGGFNLFGDPDKIRSNTSILGFYAVKQFITTDKKYVFGIEPGLSLNRHQLFTFEPNNLSCCTIFGPGPYNVVEKNEGAIGTTARITASHSVSSKLYIQLAGYFNFNKYKDVKSLLFGIFVPID